MKKDKRFIIVVIVDILAIAGVIEMSIECLKIILS